VALVWSLDPPGATELNFFGRIFSGIVSPTSTSTGARWVFAAKPDDPDEIRLWGPELQSGNQHYSLGVWNARHASEIIERAVADAKSAAHWRYGLDFVLAGRLGERRRAAPLLRTRRSGFHRADDGKGSTVLVLLLIIILILAIGGGIFISKFLFLLLLLLLLLLLFRGRF
jgi:hypothetical protein